MVAVRVPGVEAVNYVDPAKDPGEHATPDQFGAQVGQAIADVGQSISYIGRVAEGLQKRRQGDTDNIANERWKLESNDYHFNSLNDAQKNMQPGAKDFYSGLRSQWTGDQQKRLEEFQKRYNVSKDGAKQLLLTDLQLQNDYSHKAVVVENNEAVRFLGETTWKNVSNAAAGAAAHGHFADLQKTIDSNIAATGGTMGPEERARLTEGANKLVIGAFTTYADNASNQTFADKADATAKWNAFEGELKTLNISDGEKDLLRQKYSNDFNASYYQQHPDEAPRPPMGGQVTSGDTVTQASGVIKHFEGFRSNAYHDVNAPRAGYGSDTVTHPDGTFERVTRATTVTQADAERDLNRRVGVTQQGIIGKIGAEAWNRLNVDQKSAFIDLAYNYGSLPDRVVPAVKGGDANDMAQAVGRLGMDNGGINRERRATEAAMIAGRQQAGENYTAPHGFAEGMPPPDASTWMGIQKEANQQALQGAVADRQQQQFQLNQLLVGIHDGTANESDVASARKQGWLSDYGDIERVDRAMKDKTEESASIDSVMSRMAAGNGSYDPSEASDDRKAVNKLYDGAVKPGALAGGDNTTASIMASTWHETGIMPKTAKGEMLGMLRSHDTTKVNNALKYLDALERDRPDAFRREFDDATEANLATFRENLAYSSPEETAARIAQTADPEVRKGREALKKEIKPEIDKFTFEHDLAPQFDSTWTTFLSQGALKGVAGPFTPDQRANMLEDYKTLVAEQYSQTGDMDKAKREAMGRLSRVWGVSAVNGDRLMKRPPEFYYKEIDASHPHEWMQEQVLQDLDKLGLAKEEDVVTNFKVVGKIKRYPQYGLVADVKTESQISNKEYPNYQLWIVDDNGMLERVTDKNGMPQRIGFDEAAASQAMMAKREVQRQSYIEGLKQLSEQVGQVPAVNPEFGKPSATAEGVVVPSASANVRASPPEQTLPEIMQGIPALQQGAGQPGTPEMTIPSGVLPDRSRGRSNFGTGGVKGLYSSEPDKPGAPMQLRQGQQPMPTTSPPDRKVTAAKPSTKPTAANLTDQKAMAALNMNAAEKHLYKHHLDNLTGGKGVQQPDGSVSTIENITVERDGRTYVIPTVWDGEELTPHEAMVRAGKEGWKNWPSYASEDEASNRYEQLHAVMGEDVRRYLASGTSQTGGPAFGGQDFRPALRKKKPKGGNR